MAKLKEFKDLKADQDAIDEVENIDLSEYDLSGFKPVTFDFQKKTARLALRIPEEQLAALKKIAKE